MQMVSFPQKLTRHLFAVVVIAGSALAVSAAPAVVKMTTNAPAGTKMRIITEPYGATVTGAESDGFVGTYLSPGPGKEITVTLDGMTSLECYATGDSYNRLATLSVDAPDLKILRCQSNELVSLDLSKCPALETLNCSTNELTSLDLSNCPALLRVEAEHNSIATVTGTQLPALSYLKLGYNRLSSIDLSGYAGLEEIYLNNNELTSLDLSANPKLWWGYIQVNKLDDAAMTSLSEGICTAAKSPAMLYVVDSRDEAEGNNCTMASVKRMRDKSWTVMDWLDGAENTGYIGSPYNGSDYVPDISSRKITMTTSRAAGSTIKLTVKVSGDATITGVKETSSVNGTNTFTLTDQEVTISGDVTVLECPSNELTSLTFTGEPLLTALDCSDNKIERLVIDNAKAMTQVHAQKNRINKMSLNGCDALMRVDCYDNALKGARMTEFVKSLYDDKNNVEPYLFVIDTKSDTEENVCNTNQVAVATGKNWAVFDFIGGDRWGMGCRYEGSEPVGPEYPAEYFTITRPTKGEYAVTIAYEGTDFTPLLEGAELIGWNGQSVTFRFTEETATIYGDVTEVQALFGDLTAIDVTNLPSLKHLNVALNDITTLDLSGNPELQILSAEGNRLTTIDVSNNPKVDYINCYGNLIAGQGMTDMVASLPMLSAESHGTLIVYDASYKDEGNRCLMADVEAARAKYWVAAELDENSDPVAYKGYDYSGVAEIEAGAGEAPVYYTLTGVIVKGTPAPGVYVVRRGAKVSKEYVR